MSLATRPAGGTIPADVLVTPDRPDIVIYDKKKKTMHVFELTVPYEHNLEKRHTDKLNKYAYMSTDIRKFKPVIEAFEVGARGYISSENKSRIKQIHNFCKKETTKKQFIENIAKLAIYGSYHVYLCRNQTEWAAPALLSV